MLNSNFYFFLIARSFLVFANVGYVMVITIFIYSQTGSAAYASIFPFINTIGAIISGFLSPLIVEKVGNKQTFVIFPLLTASIVTLFLLLFDVLSAYIFMLFIFVAIVALLDGIVRPVFSSTLPMIVPESLLIKANGYFSFSFQLIQIGGYTLTGIMVTIIGEVNMLLIVSISLWIAVLFLFLVVKNLEDFQTVTSKTSSKWHQLKEGWVLLWNNKKIRAITMMDVSEGMAGAVWIGAITLVFVNEILNQSAEWWGYINSAYYAGTLLGGIVAITMAKFLGKNLFLSIAIGSFLYSLLSIVYGLNSNPMIAVLLVLLMGPVYQMRDISQQTLMQKSAPPRELSKIYAAHTVLSSAAMGFSVFIVGVVADLVGVQYVYIGGGILVLLVSSTAIVILSKYFRISS